MLISKSSTWQQKKDPYMLPFIDEVINTIVEHEVYIIFDRFS
jgi:hypothetical protein